MTAKELHNKLQEIAEAYAIGYITEKEWKQRKKNLKRRYEIIKNQNKKRT